jgi:hypothetical protein
MTVRGLALTADVAWCDNEDLVSMVLTCACCCCLGANASDGLARLTWIVPG